MGIRQSLSEHPKTAGGIAIAILVIAIAAIVHTGVSQPEPSPINMYFSNDDGTSYFGGEGAKLFEMQERTKPAYPATVYTCDGGTHSFVAFLTRTPMRLIIKIKQVSAQAQKIRAQSPVNDPKVQQIESQLNGLRNSAGNDVDVKRPGAANKWVAINSVEGRNIVNNVKCPRGSGIPQMIIPH